MQDLRKQVVSNTIWKFLERFIAQGVTVIVSLVIARILNPKDYGVVSIVTIFFNFANVIISGGLNTALIQKKDADSEDYSTILYASLIISVICYFILFFCAPLIANIYNEDSLILIIRIMGFSLPITAIKSIWCAYISANLQFKKFFFATLGGTIVSAFIGIFLAIKGYGPWALVAQQMTNTIIDTIILVVFTRIHIVFKISIQKFKVLFKYGWKIFISSIISTLYSEISPLVIGIKFSTNDLSFYTKGKSLPSMLSTASTNTLSAVLFPVLAKFQDDKDKILKYTRLYMQIASFVAFPCMLGFFAIAENFVLVVLTEKWLFAVYYIRLFSICGMFDIIAVGNCETIKAIGRSDTFLIMEIIKKTCYFIVLSIFIVFSKSPTILAISSVVCTIIQILVNSIPNIKLIGYKFKDQLLDITPNVITSVFMACFVFLIGYFNINRVLLLIIQVIVGVVIYLLLNIIVKNKNLKTIFSIVKGLVNRSNKNEKR